MDFFVNLDGYTWCAYFFLRKRKGESIMSNELMLLAELLVVYALILVFWRLWGKVGLVCWLGFATYFS